MSFLYEDSLHPSLIDSATLLLITGTAKAFNLIKAIINMISNTLLSLVSIFRIN